MSKADERIGTNVHELLWRQKKRQRVLMTAMDLSRSSLAKKLRGEVTWSAEDIEAAAQVLDVDPGRLFVLPHTDSNRESTGKRMALAVAA